MVGAAGAATAQATQMHEPHSNLQKVGEKNFPVFEPPAHKPSMYSFARAARREAADPEFRNLGIK